MLVILAVSNNAGSGESVQMRRRVRAYAACITQRTDVGSIGDSPHNLAGYISMCVCLTHLCRMYFPILINLTSPCSVLRLLSGIFHYYSNFKRNSGELDQTPRSAASDLVLHCWPMSHKKDARLIYGLRRLFGNCY